MTLSEKSNKPSTVASKGTGPSRPASRGTVRSATHAIKRQRRRPCPCLHGTGTGRAHQWRGIRPAGRPAAGADRIECSARCSPPARRGRRRSAVRSRGTVAAQCVTENACPLAVPVPVRCCSRARLRGGAGGAAARRPQTAHSRRQRRRFRGSTSRGGGRERQLERGVPVPVRALWSARCVAWGDVRSGDPSLALIHASFFQGPHVPT